MYKNMYNLSLYLVLTLRHDSMYLHCQYETCPYVWLQATTKLMSHTYRCYIHKMHLVSVCGLICAIRLTSCGSHIDIWCIYHLDDRSISWNMYCICVLINQECIILLTWTWTDVDNKETTIWPYCRLQNRPVPL
jgi:hypothetical protein